MKSMTAEALLSHRKTCGGFQFDRSSYRLEPTDTEETVSYQCRKCGFEIKEGPGANLGQQTLPLAEKAA